MSEPIAARLAAAGPKRMLALDGGGTRGIVTIAFLAEIERTLQAKLGRGDDFVLSDYFDMIGGTSVGAMVATMLAMGWRVERIERTFREWAPDIFKVRWFGRTFLRPRFKARVLSEKVRSIVGSEPMRSARLKTGLCVVAKRADTGSVWVLTNNPASRYWNAEGTRIANGDYLIHDIVRASTAAPTYFRPMRMVIHGGKGQDPVEGLFMDGGVSPHNSPALQLFKLAGLKGYNLGGADLKVEPEGRRWDYGDDKLLIISVGNGTFSTSVGKDYYFVARQAVDALQGMMDDARELGTGLLQWLGRCRLHWQIDSEVGDLSRDEMTVPPMLAFQRYDMRLEKDWLQDEPDKQGKVKAGVRPGVHLKRALAARHLDLDRDLKALRRLDAPREMGELHRLASAAALDQVSPLDFPEAFDKVWTPEPVARTDGSA